MTDKRLLLWDIDSTLITTGGAGEKALQRITKERFGASSDLHDAEHGIWLSVQADEPAERVRGAIQLLAPEAIAEYGDQRDASVGIHEGTSNHGRRA